MEQLVVDKQAASVKVVQLAQGDLVVALKMEQLAADLQFAAA